MPTIFELDWENENALSAYPFSQDAPVNSVIVDASFQQFNNFIPILNYVLVSSTSLEVNLTYDTGINNFILQQSDYNSGINFIRMFDSTRYIGRLTFGSGVNSLWNTYVGQKVAFNLPFVATTIRSIGLKSGVFSIASLYGNVLFTNASTDTTIFFNTFSPSSATFNAVGNHELPASPPPQALKLLNLMTPKNNNVFISSSEVIQINADGLGNLNINLVGSQPTTVPNKIVNTTGF